MVSIISCQKLEIEPLPKPVEDIFLLSETKVVDGQDISFNIDLEGSYIVKLIDLESNNVISKEKTQLIKGKNTIKIFTKSIPSQYLYLVLEDENKKEIKRTKLTLN